ncbi:uncharacterized protein LOC123566548 [Mercenaria mercenaria]|uniref:uncharacterized protein LOC123566548 n=1 Tax=Mercenaria mercenaria TaxID=6596 RepID=UPI001E1E0B54|nr:uncharacterized protein LOC123566548 [Mercenaria mercenaria]
MARQERGLILLNKIENGDKDGVKQILNNDTDLTVDRKGDTPIHLAARKGNLDILELLIQNGCNVNQKNQNGFAALHYAAREGRMDIVCFLLKYGAEPNIKNEDGDGPIHELVKFQPMDVIEEMVSLGMDVNLQNKIGSTPLHVAVANNHQEAVETLLTCGARSNLKDKYGRTAEESCKNSQMLNMMRMHTLTMEAMKKGIIQAQGISITRKKAKERITLKRVGVVIETISLTTDVTASFYCRREKSENSSYSFCTEDGDEMLSDVFFIKITGVPRVCEVTLTLPIYGLPSAQEELFVRFKSGARLTVTQAQTTIEGRTCTFKINLTPESFSVCALFTCTKTEVKQVDHEGGVITADADKEMLLEIPPNTFSQEANISIKVFPTESEARQRDDVVLTDIYTINTDIESSGKNSMTLTVPLHHSVDKTEDIIAVTADEISDDTDENCLSVIDSKPVLKQLSLVYEIPHFSIHVAVSRSQFETNKKNIFDRLVSATERQRTAVFFVVVRHENNGTSPIIVVECCIATNATKRIKKWISKGYITQDPEQSGSFLLKPYQEFTVSFQGAKCTDSNEERKLAFLPRRPSFQPYRISAEVNTECCIDGSVFIKKASKDDGKSSNSETVTSLHFHIKLKEDDTNTETKKEKEKICEAASKTYTEEKKNQPWLMPDYLNE